MYRILLIAVVVGVVSGLIVGGFHNLFTVPVMERAIVLEEGRAAAEGAVDVGGVEVPLGVQRIGLVFGVAIITAVYGLLFTGGYWLTRRIAPNWHPLAIALLVGVLGFWTFSLFPFIKYPVNPPGVGAESTLLSRQYFQLVTIFLSAAATIGVLLAIKLINTGATELSQRAPKYLGLAVAYLIFVGIVLLLVPSNPDPVPVPIDLLELFRALTMIGHFLQWMLLGLGVGLVIMWRQRSGQSVFDTTPTRSAIVQ
ncbi:MAG: CbtA family protein [Chloroflexi bacterium]|nr:CbtA family protein [Chloroflexota bacterium]MDA1218911.1 CbtA family protein [Chloroflexota bacterium]